MKKVLSLILALLVMLCPVALADMTEEEYADAAKVFPTSYEGKTVILHSNDVHGALTGYAYIAAMKAYIEERGAEVILTDSGDFSQGNTYVSVSKGASAVDMMNAAGYDVVTLGNHEFDFGYAQLMENLSAAEFHPICCNIILDETGKPILDGHTIIETASGLKLGFFGMETPETATKVNPGMIREISFLTFDAMYAAAQAEIDALRAEGADLVIALTHLGVDKESKANGNRSIDLLAHVSGVDIVLDAHSHTIMTAGEHGEPIQSTGTKFDYIGVVVIDNETKTIEDHYLISTANLPMDADVLAKAQGIMDEVDAIYGAVFAKTEVLLNGERDPGNRTEETNLGDLITDAMLWSVAKEAAPEQDEPYDLVCITNGGGIRATLQPGDITMNDIHTVLPFGNTVAVVYVTGEEILEALEASTFATPEAIGGYPQTSGFTWTLDTTKPYDQGALYILDGKETTYYGPASIRRVSIQTVNGKPFDPAATYAVVTNDFCAAGGDTYNVFGRAYANGSTYDTGIPMDEATISYITEVLGGDITAEQYGEPAGRETQIREEPAETEETPAAA